MGNFWITFAINEAITVAQGFVAASKLTDPVKAAVENFITSGQAVLTALHLA